MTGPLVVADIGNTRVKWGLCDGKSIDRHVSLPADDPATWDSQVDAWAIPTATWAVASVQPQTRERLVAWLRERERPTQIIDLPSQVPLQVALDHPERVGIDRLLDAVAANQRRPANARALIVDAGSAVTVDVVDERGVFRGGAILPGLRLMAEALHDHTALLPIVPITNRRPPPGTSTIAAIETGVFHAVVGGIDRLLSDLHADGAVVYFTGGDAPILAPHLRTPVDVWPEMTLEGIRIAARGAGS